MTRRRQLFLIVTVALAARLAFVAVRGTFTAPDTAEYRLLARNVLRFHTFSMNERPPIDPAIRRPPVYPLFLALFMPVSPSPIAPAVAQAVLDALICAMAFLMALRVVRWPFAIAASLAYVFHPGAISTSATILSDAVFTFLLCAAVFLALFAAERLSPILALSSGTAFGLAALCRSIGVVYLISIAVVLLARRFGRTAVIVVVTAIIVIAPWIIRSSRVAGRFVFIQAPSSFGWYLPTLWWMDQNDEPAIWRYYLSGADPYGLRLETARTPRAVLEADDFARRQAVVNIRKNPSRYLQSRVRAFPHLFLNTFDQFTGINRSLGDVVRAHDVPALTIKLVLLLLFSAIPMVAACLGLPASRRTLMASMAAAIWLITLAFHIPVWIEYRYWLPAVPFQLVTAALGIQTVLDRVRADYQPDRAL